MTETSKTNIRCWYYTNSFSKTTDALEDLIQGSFSGYVCDGRNKPSDTELKDGCFGIVIAKASSGKFYGQVMVVTEKTDIDCETIWGYNHSSGTVITYKAKPISQVACIDGIISQSDLCQSGLKLNDRPAVMAYLLGNF